MGYDDKLNCWECGVELDDTNFYGLFHSIKLRLCNNKKCSRYGLLTLVGKNKVIK
jgi:hypothetical protein